MFVLHKPIRVLLCLVIALWSPAVCCCAAGGAGSEGGRAVADQAPESAEECSVTPARCHAANPPPTSSSPACHTDGRSGDHPPHGPDSPCDCGGENASHLSPGDAHPALTAGVSGERLPLAWPPALTALFMSLDTAPTVPPRWAADAFHLPAGAGSLCAQHVLLTV